MIFIDSILVTSREICDRYKRQLSADLFGRIPFNQHDNIGQRVENFAKRVDVIYPMLYPSHFTDCEWYLRDPGKAIHDGTTRCLDRTKEHQVKIVPYIQAFTYNIGWAGTNLEGYIAMQVKAAEATPARAWVAWNARGDYAPLFNAVLNLDRARSAEAATVQ
jgi:hypothetical protein